jgi:hypothetical protein
MSEDLDYKIERAFIATRVSAVDFSSWVDRIVIEQTMSPQLMKDEADRVFQRLCDSFKPRAGMRLGLLVKQVGPDPSKGCFRVTISIKLLRELFANELMGWGGGGGKGLKQINNPLQTTLRRR